MDAGGLAQMSFNGPTGLPMPGSGLASRRGGQNIKPLSFDTLKPVADKETGVATPRTSRSHLLAGLRTAPKSATAATFPASPTTAAPTNQRSNRNSMIAGAYGGSDNTYSAPKTSQPRFAQSQTFNNVNAYGQQVYTADQILAPPEIQLDEVDSNELGAEYAEMVATNMYLAAQKQRLQQQLMSVQAAQQQFQNLSLASNGNHQVAYQQFLLQQQQQQQQLLNAGLAGGNVYAVVDPLTGQQTLYVGGGGAAQLNNHFVDQYNANLQQLQQLQLLQQQMQQQQQLQQQQQQQQQHQHQQRQPSPINPPRVQVSPPPAEAQLSNGFRNPSPPRRYESPDQHTPLPPPSANAFRRGHKKSTSVAGMTLNTNVGNGSANNNGNNNSNNAEPPKSAGPKSSGFPPSALQTGTYGPGQGRAGEHPVRQPRGPPNFEELARKPTSKHEGSKNFAARTRRSAVHNLMRAGISRRQVTPTSSTGSVSPISETAEEAYATRLTDNESESGRSGSGSLNGDDVECSLPSSRTSTGSWGAIGSERPGSREKARKASLDASSSHNDADSTNGSFASVFKAAAAPANEGQRKAPMLVLSNAEKRRCVAA